MNFSLSAVEICDASFVDMAEIEAIYAYHVLNTLVSLEEMPPSREELNDRRLTSLERGMPYVVAKLGDQVVGYSYAALYRPRSGYRFTVEDSVYISPEYKGMGVGTLLLSEVIRRCRENGYRQMIAVIAGSENKASVNLHSRLGFVTVGVLKAVGFKFDTWVDNVLMQRELNE